jgi:site-specific DNA-methyltransferase (adenine-specific)
MIKIVGEPQGVGMYPRNLGVLFIMISEVENIDCMVMMERYPDKFFDLAIVDPPYGMAEKITSGGTWASKLSAEDHKWDIIPDASYFAELFRVSKNQIIWGGNYFILPASRCFIIWDKKLTDNWTLAMAEYAWTSFDQPAKIYRGLTDNGSRGIERIHICQKPINLYRWCLKFYGSPGDKILDTHLGSGSSRIAAYKLGFDFWGCELDKDYFEAQEKRFKAAINEPLFQTQPDLVQGKLI